MMRILTDCSKILNLAYTSPKRKRGQIGLKTFDPLLALRTATPYILNIRIFRPQMSLFSMEIANRHAKNNLA